MATAFTEKTRTERLGSHTVFSAAPQDSTCARCGGLMVTEFCMDLLFCIGETELAAQRCVQCVRSSILSFYAIGSFATMRRRLGL
jgi:hypothetical protein